MKNKYNIGDIIVSQKGKHIIIAGYLYEQGLYQLIPISGYNINTPYYLERPYVEDKYNLVSKA